MVEIHKNPVWSSAIPKICSCKYGGASGGASTRSDCMKASPAAPPIHRIPRESTNRQLRFSDGNPSRVPKVRQRPRKNELSPFGVANHMVPSELSAMEAKVLEARPEVVS